VTLAGEIGASVPLQVEIGGVHNLGEVVFSTQDIKACQQAFRSTNPIHDRGVVFGALELGRVTEMVRDWAIATDLLCRNKVAVTVASIELLGLMKAEYRGQLEILVTHLIEVIDPDWLARVDEADGLLEHVIGVEIEFDFQVRRVSRETGEPQSDLFCWGTLCGTGKL